MDLSADTANYIRQLRAAVADLDNPESPSDALSVIADVLKLTRLLAPEYIDDARQHGQSWAAVGGAFGITMQGAQQRFGKSASPIPVTGPPVALGGRRERPWED